MHNKSQKARSPLPGMSSIQAMTGDGSMKYNINVTKSAWRRVRKPSRATLAAIGSQDATCKAVEIKRRTQTLDCAGATGKNESNKSFVKAAVILCGASFLLVTGIGIVTGGGSRNTGATASATEKGKKRSPLRTAAGRQAFKGSVTSLDEQKSQSTNISRNPKHKSTNR